ncbi:MAG: amidohydrolase [Rhodothalassiaceae bacterium]
MTGRQRRRSHQLVLCAILGLGLLTAGPGPARADDLLFFGGPIHTGRDDRPQVEAVLVAGERIAFAGNLAAARARMAEGTHEIDLKGAALFPGFTDSHAHLYGIGLRELTLNLEGTASIAELRDRVAEAAAKAAPGAVIVGRGWIETHWPEARFPNRHDLDAVVSDRPVILTRADGHALVANSRALARAGITRDTEPPFGGDILKDADGEPTGMIIDAAMGLLAPLLRAAEEVDPHRVYEAANRVYTARGWTGIHSMSVDPARLDLIEALADAGVLKLRIYNSVDRKGAGALFESGPRASKNGRVTTRAIKLYMDGALGSRGAALLAPYSDAPKTAGLLQMKKADTMPLLQQALERGIQVNTHAIGDRGNRLVLDWYAEAFASVPEDARAVASPRWRIEHAQILDPADIPRFAQLGVIASMQPSHAISDLYFAPARLGPDRLAGAYAWHSLVDSGAVIAAGSDAPVERGDPLIEFYAAVARRSLDGFSGPGWHPGQAVDRATALRMLTLWPAYARFAERDLGTIAAGKLADLTVFSGDLMTLPVAEIPRQKALMTVIGGAIVYRADGF